MSDKLIIKILAIIAGIAVATIIMILIVSRQRDKQYQAISDLNFALQDSLRVTKNKLGQLTTTTTVLTAENTYLFTNIKSKDAEVIRLQNVVKTYEKKNGDLNTALAISDETVMNLQDSITNKIIGYSTTTDTTGLITRYPIYTRSFTKEWYHGDVTVGLDTLALHVTNINAYDITIGEEKVSLFKKKLFANVTNLNPNTETKVLKVYQKQEVKTKVGGFLLKNGVKIGIGIGIGYILFK
jgi:hypothetical protein